MRKEFIHLLILLFCFLGCEKDSVSADQSKPADKEGWRLVWSDEFSADGLPDATKWGYDSGGHGWGNQELQYYNANRLENARVEKGHLIIEARRDNHEGHEYTSARLVTRNKGDWTYGRFEISAKLPAGRGTWPAIWMLPTRWSYGDGGWPANGEIDVMEHVGYDMGVIHASIHCQAYNHPQNTQKSARLYAVDVASRYHLYALEWSPTEIKAFVNDSLYFSFQNGNSGWETWPFDKEFHLLLNIAVGGTWGGARGVDNAIFPQRMEVDYVRVYEAIDEP